MTTDFCVLTAAHSGPWAQPEDTTATTSRPGDLVARGTRVTANTRVTRVWASGTTGFRVPTAVHPSPWPRPEDTTAATSRPGDLVARGTRVTVNTRVTRTRAPGATDFGVLTTVHLGPWARPEDSTAATSRPEACA